MMGKVILVIGAAALLGGCQTTQFEVGNGLFACEGGRVLRVREEGAKRIVTMDDGPAIILSPMPQRRKLWWTAGNDHSLRIEHGGATWMVRNGNAYRRDWCPRMAASA